MLQDMWEDICTEEHLVTNSNVWREFKWKVIMRFFWLNLALHTQINAGETVAHTLVIRSTYFGAQNWVHFGKSV